jgi:hypothetical protein
MTRLVGLYPRHWRSRYEAELLDLLHARPPSVLEQVDIVRGALDAHLHPQVIRPGAPAPAPIPDDNARMTRQLGIGTLLGAALWIAAFAVTMLGPVLYDGYGAYRDGSGAMPFLLGAVCLLAGGLGGQLLKLPRDARVARVGAGAALVFLIAWAVQPWQLWIGAFLIGGLVVMALGAYRSLAWPGRTSAAVVIPCLAVAGLIGLGYSLDLDRMTGAVLFAVGGVVVMPAWLSIGTTLLRRPA